MTATAKPPSKIMMIRHAEKPTGNIQGVNPAGQNDPNSLIVQGWQRAGALVCLFGPDIHKKLYPALATPHHIYASGVTSVVKPGFKCDSSLRPQQTIDPLGARLGIQPNIDFCKGQETDLIKDVLGHSGCIVLIAWQHESIPDIVSALAEKVKIANSYPSEWCGDRFDLVWVFDLTVSKSESEYTFTEVHQLLLSGDSSKPMENPCPKNGD